MTASLAGRVAGHHPRRRPGHRPRIRQGLRRCRRYPGHRRAQQRARRCGCRRNRPAGGRARAITTDVADAKSVDAMAKAVKEFGRIDILINNAAIFSTLEMRPFEDQIPPAEWEAVLRVNVTGASSCAPARWSAPCAGRLFGRIINMASGAVSSGGRTTCTTSPRKRRSKAWPGRWRAELGRTGYTANAILPGATFTEIKHKPSARSRKRANRRHAMHRAAGGSADLVGTALFLASDAAASFLTGRGITVDGGATPEPCRCGRPYVPTMTAVPIESIRNFAIIAHIDHGKSTLADRLIQLTGGLADREIVGSFNSMDIERERGITVKRQQFGFNYKARNGKEYILNLIDTPGHVDFAYEVNRSFAACEGSLLVVDASQGVEAQTLANVYQALDNNHEIVPVLNKVDLPAAEPEKVKQQIEDVIGYNASDASIPRKPASISRRCWKRSCITCAAEGRPDAPLKALLVDSWYDLYLGVVVLVRIVAHVCTRTTHPHDPHQYILQ